MLYACNCMLILINMQRIFLCQVCKESLSNGKSVVVDNTNPKEDGRKSFIQLAQKHGKALHKLTDI